MDVKYDLIDKAKRGTLIQGNSLSFGALRTDHMFVANYADGKWQNARIMPYSPFSIMPGAIVIHYAQSIFEGAKGFQHPDGEIYLYRIDKNIERLNHSARILAMPEVPADMHMDGIMRLIDIERAWCPTIPESSMYVRPFMFGTQDSLGVKPSNSYMFCVLLSPSGPYYASGFAKPIKLLISTHFHRAVTGGTGSSKCGGNYAASLLAGEYAHKKGASQVLYLDANNEYIEEAGSMNHFHVLKDGTFIIPEFNDSILKSITSLSILELAKMGKLKARQEKIQIDDFINKVRSGEIIEAGGFGTAAVVSPVGAYIFEDGSELVVGDGQIGRYSRQVYEMYSAMQVGKAPAPEGWLFKVPHFGI